MTFLDAFHLALRNLRQSKLRTALTTLGVAIGIASLAGMVSLGVGLEDQLVGGFMRSGVFDSITVMPGNPAITRAGLFGRGGRRGQAGGRGGGRDAGGDAGRGAGRGADAAPVDDQGPALDDEALAKLAALDKVKSVYPMVRVTAELRYGDFAQFVSASGVPMSARDEGAFRSIAFGGFFASETDNACLLTLDMAKRLTDDPKTLIGKAVTLSYAASVATPAAAGATSAGGDAPAIGPAFQVRQVDTQLTVAGIVERETGGGFPGGAGVTGLMLPIGKAKELDGQIVTSVQSMLRGAAARKSYQSATVKVAHAQDTRDVQDRIKGLGFTTFSINDALDNSKRAFVLLDIMLGLIGSIALAVSSLGIVNTMVMSILERTREIGVMKAIGGSDGDVRRIFLVEAAAIGLLGGLSGIALGWVVGRIINFGANVYIEREGGTAVNLFSLPWWLIGGALGFAIVMSLAAGTYPARRAARLNPIDALRHD